MQSKLVQLLLLGSVTFGVGTALGTILSNNNILNGLVTGGAAGSAFIAGSAIGNKKEDKENNSTEIAPYDNLQELQQEKELLEQSLAGDRTTIQQLEFNITSLQTEHNQIGSEIAELQNQKEELDRELIKLENQNNKIKLDFANCESEYQDKHSNINKLSIEIEKLQQEVAQRQEQKEDLDRNILALENNQQELEFQNQQLHDNIKQIEIERSQSELEDISSDDLLIDTPELDVFGDEGQSSDEAESDYSHQNSNNNHEEVREANDLQGFLAGTEEFVRETESTVEDSSLVAEAYSDNLSSLGVNNDTSEHIEFQEDIDSIDSLDTKPDTTVNSHKNTDDFDDNSEYLELEEIGLLTDSFIPDELPETSVLIGSLLAFNPEQPSSQSNDSEAEVNNDFFDSELEQKNIEEELGLQFIEEDNSLLSLETETTASDDFFSLETEEGDSTEEINGELDSLFSLDLDMEENRKDSSRSVNLNSEETKEDLWLSMASEQEFLQLEPVLPEVPADEDYGETIDLKEQKISEKVEEFFM